MRVLRAALAASFLAVPLVVLHVPAAHACSCAYEPEPPTEAEVVGRADGVFTGVVTAVDDLSEDEQLSGDRDVVYTFDISEVTKGRFDPPEVVTNADEASCGTRFRMGREYRVFAERERGEWRTGLCSYNHRTDQEPPYVVEAATTTTTQALPPPPPAPPPPPTTAPEPPPPPTTTSAPPPTTTTTAAETLAVREASSDGDGGPGPVALIVGAGALATAAGGALAFRRLGAG